MAISEAAIQPRLCDSETTQSRLGLELTVLGLDSPGVRDSIKFRLFMSCPRKNSGRHKVRGKKWFSQRDTYSIHQSVSSVTQSCPTLSDPMNCSTPGLPVHHQLPEFTQTHVHRVGDAIQPSHPLLSPSPPAPNPSQPSESFPMSQLFA